MSGYPNPNNFNQHNYYAQQGHPGHVGGIGSPAMNPQVLMGAGPAAGAGMRPQPFNPGMATGSPTPIRGQIGPAQLQTLTDHHNSQRQQQMLALQQQQQQQQQQHQQPIHPPQQQTQYGTQSQSFAPGQQRPTLVGQQPIQGMQQILQARAHLLQIGQPVPAAMEQLYQQIAAQAQARQQLQQHPRRPSLPPSQSSQPSQLQTQGIAINQAQPTLRPALLAAAAAARTSQPVSAHLPSAPSIPSPPVGVPQNTLSHPLVVPVTKAFIPAARTPSPKKEVIEPTPLPATSAAAAVEITRSDADKEKDKVKKKKDKAKVKDKEPEKVEDGEKATEEAKTKKARPKEKKPRPKKEKNKDSGSAAADSAVFFAAVEPVSKELSTPAAVTEVKVATLSSAEASKTNRLEVPVQLAERAVSPVRPASIAPASAVAAISHAPIVHQHTAVAEVRRRRDEGMRGSMRNEIARLMYGAGDVVEPDIDTVDYMEDLVTDFLADLSRPIPPLRSGPGAQHQPVPLSFEIIRHRLSATPTTTKYLERFDHMVHMSDVLKAHRRIANPSVNDLVEQVGNDYLGLDEEGKLDPHGRAQGHGEGRQNKRSAGARGAGAEDGRPRKKGRPLKTPGERKKPGPQKGWKLNREPGAPVPSGMRRSAFKDPHAPKRKYVRKSIGAGGVGTGVKRDPSSA